MSEKLQLFEITLKATNEKNNFHIKEENIYWILDKIKNYDIVLFHVSIIKPENSEDTLINGIILTESVLLSFDFKQYQSVVFTSLQFDAITFIQETLTDKYYEVEIYSTTLFKLAIRELESQRGYLEAIIDKIREKINR